MRIAYVDGIAGASGDMILGAMLDAGLSLHDLRSELARIPIDGYELTATQTRRAGIAATLAVVQAGEHHRERRLSDILSVIRSSDLPPADRERIESVFTRLAEAEASVHAVTPEEVHFHEVGAVDAIVDIAGAVIGLRLLGVERLYCGPLTVGSGVARSAHGELPAPAPATLRLLEMAAAPLVEGWSEPGFEALTPTGAAILTVLAEFGRPAMRLTRIGYGAGARDPEGRANVLRLWLGETLAPAPARAPERLLLFEANIDDMSPELFEPAQERIFAAGALDVWTAPIQMKKGRPAVLLSALGAAGAEADIANAFLRETSTLGVRVREVWRHEAERFSFTFASSLGEVRAKARLLPDGTLLASVEYESCREVARATGRALPDVYRRLEAEAQAEAERRYRSSADG